MLLFAFHFPHTDDQSIERYLRSLRRKQRQGEAKQVKPKSKKKDEKTVRVETMQLIGETMRNFGAFIAQQQQQMVHFNVNSFNNLSGSDSNADQMSPVNMQSVFGGTNVKNTGFK